MLQNGKIAFQGEYGANSDIACQNVFPMMERIPCVTFDDAFNVVETGDVDLAMIPIENTLAGRVADIHRLLPRSRLFIIGEYFLPIHFHLMVLPGVKKEEIQTIHSHIHALEQCRNIIRKNGWKAIVTSDTAGAAKLVFEMGERSMAAIAPYLAARLYKLDILEKNVEDSKKNITRFVVLSRTENRPVRMQKEERFVTSLLFHVKNVPAALYKSLGSFATCGINMTKLESYQIGNSFLATQFYAEIEGHPDDFLMQSALEELSFFSRELRIVGVYYANPEKEKILKVV